jgi:hypothetical protein
VVAHWCSAPRLFGAVSRGEAGTEKHLQFVESVKAKLAGAGASVEVQALVEEALAEQHRRHALNMAAEAEKRQKLLDCSSELKASLLERCGVTGSSCLMTVINQAGREASVGWEEEACDRLLVNGLALHLDLRPMLCREPLTFAFVGGGRVVIYG